MHGPFPTIALHRRFRRNRAPALVGIVDRDLQIPAGTELHLKRLHDGRLTSPEFSIAFVPSTSEPLPTPQHEVHE